MKRWWQTGLIHVLDRVLNPRSCASGLQRTTLGLAGRAQPGATQTGSRQGPHPQRTAGARVGHRAGALFVGVLGPAWAPENPYVSHNTSSRTMMPGSRGHQPTAAPSSESPFGTDRWGNDLLSLLMHGARNTLVACTFVTMARCYSA